MPNHENNKDWFRLYRSLLQDPMWLEEPFTRGQAWVDLIARANWTESVIVNGPHPRKIMPGQVVTSIDALAKRWKWGTTKVRNYLQALTEMKNITTDRTTHGTIITIENYGFYQGREQTNRITDPTTKTKRTEEQKPNKNQTDHILYNKNNKEIQERKEGEEYAHTREAPKGSSDSWQMRLIARTLAQLKENAPDVYEDALADAKKQYGDEIDSFVQKEKETGE